MKTTLRVGRARRDQAPTHRPLLPPNEVNPCLVLIRHDLLTGISHGIGPCCSVAVSSHRNVVHNNLKLSTTRDQDRPYVLGPTG